MCLTFNCDISVLEWIKEHRNLFKLYNGNFPFSWSHVMTEDYVLYDNQVLNWFDINVNIMTVSYSTCDEEYTDIAIMKCEKYENIVNWFKTNREYISTACYPQTLVMYELEAM